ncbi:hypothetical protein GZH47_31330 [Paenibacillus rhizovicinus]|uniref:TnsA endonuclease N-terminal domain-containing protein n=1 Tax=Paenibacillus rhizovicinus TaxID=2704463 RepID=A0A6C0PB08_9BACL|nr:TnsA endonuclease N-terminal domain-containing protein [Paenibacillus rhizovicinus]QHW34843.1 hypothetical protein GZH47_31330 [Paenibacillus rhizovicinus]
MYTPVKMPRNTKYGSNYWKATSRKIKRRVEFFSDLEYDHWILVESNPNIVSFCEQPLRIRHTHKGEIVESVFDMWVLYSDGTEKFIEVKYEWDFDSRNPKSIKTIRQTGAQEDWCLLNNKPYEIMTDTKIRSNALLLSNLKQIISYTRNRLVPIELDQFQITRLVRNRRLTIGEIQRDLHSLKPQRILESICNLIYSGHLDANIEECLIGPSLEVWLHGET